MININTIIQLINAKDLDCNYNHSVMFNSKESQNLYFRERTIYTIDDSNYHRKDGNYRIDYTLRELKNVNYLIANNGEGEKYFYFIIDKVYINDSVTELLLQLDVVQTYLFDITFRDCFIEREHCRRFDENGKAIAYTQDENLETGEYTVVNTTPIYQYDNKGCYIFTSSDRLGVSTDGRPGENPRQRGRRNTEYIRKI